MFHIKRQCVIIYLARQIEDLKQRRPGSPLQKENLG